METGILKVPSRGHLGRFEEPAASDGLARLERWTLDGVSDDDLAPLKHAAEYLRTKDTPVAFPTETVYGLGADATRSASTRGIYTAKGRPADNPLIIHVCDLTMLRGLIAPADSGQVGDIPSIYRPLLERFWPGPLTILLPNPEPSHLAPEVTAGLKSFGVRMPSSPLALTLIKLAGVPLAAPSANASTKPSPTTAQHVKHDLDGRIEMILDGGACDVGVESTVVDGLCDPPVVLRPGGIGMEQLRGCPGWEAVLKGYRDESEEGKSAPRAPGMKYKHYSPKARVVLYESSFKKGANGVVDEDAEKAMASINGAAPASESVKRKIGIIRTQRWSPGAGLTGSHSPTQQTNGTIAEASSANADTQLNVAVFNLAGGGGQVLDVHLGTDTKGIAQGLFSALREMDRRGAETIFVDGIDDELDIAAAVMNRLRKAASEIRA